MRKVAALFLLTFLCADLAFAQQGPQEMPNAEEWMWCVQKVQTAMQAVAENKNGEYENLGWSFGAQEIQMQTDQGQVVSIFAVRHRYRIQGPEDYIHGDEVFMFGEDGSFVDSQPWDEFAAKMKRETGDVLGPLKDMDK